jgi:hypothetical protein
MEGVIPPAGQEVAVSAAFPERDRAEAVREDCPAGKDSFISRKHFIKNEHYYQSPESLSWR